MPMITLRLDCVFDVVSIRSYSRARALLAEIVSMLIPLAKRKAYAFTYACQVNSAIINNTRKR